MIGIAALTLVPGQVGGSETYLRELLRALDPDALPFRVLLPPAAAGLETRLPTAIAPGGTPRTAATRLASMAAALADPRLRRPLADAAVVHYPLTIPLPPSRAATIVTLHDVQHLELPHLFGAAERAFRRLAYDRAARRATRIVVVSGFVRDRAAALLGLDPGRIRVIHSGVDHAVFRPEEVEREPFLLYPARPWPHKNHRRLLEAFALVRRERPELRLILTGGGAHGPLPDGVEAAGLVGLDELASLYRRASAVVFPSLYEGFGQPILEAMACGCPVACSEVASLPEVAGGAARLFDPEDPRSIADAVHDVLAASPEWSARGVERAAAFSWAATARAHEALYRELSNAS
jgi:glycosyltransferase involved in cell wall biosynthesis